MDADTDELDVVGYVFGDLPLAQASRVEKMAAKDAELAAKIAIIRAATGETRSRRSSWRRVIHVVAAVGIILAGVGAAWAVFAPRALLTDNFNDGWFDSRVWLPPPVFNATMGVKEQNGYLKLVNRGYLVTRGEFLEPVSVSFDWSWSELGLNPLYADHLSVVLRTHGEPDPSRAFEVRDGVVVRFNAWSGVVEMWNLPEEEHMASTEPGAVKLPAEAWHHIRITDDGEHVAVYVTGPGNGDRDPKKPVLSAACPTSTNAGRIAIYNREKLSDVPYESYIDNISVEDMPSRRR